MSFKNSTNGFHPARVWEQLHQIPWCSWNLTRKLRIFSSLSQICSSGKKMLRPTSEPASSLLYLTQFNTKEERHSSKWDDEDFKAVCCDGIFTYKVVNAFHPLHAFLTLDCIGKYSSREIYMVWVGSKFETPPFGVPDLKAFLQSHWHDVWRHPDSERFWGL